MFFRSWSSFARMEASARRRSSRSVANDAIIRAAIVDEIAVVGVDVLGPTGVARRAGLTTGAVYGRYESVPEMLVDVWITDLRDVHVHDLNRLISAMDQSVAPTDMVEVVTNLASPSTQTRAAVELLTAAHRIDELDEVIGDDVAQWRQTWGIGTGDDDRDARVLWTLAAAWGVALFALAGLPDPGWQQSFRWAHRAAQTPYVPGHAPGPVEVPDLQVDTGDETRDQLLTATMEVMSRVGLERTTTSRIARRAGLGQNWIYAGYASKEDLLVDTLAVLLNKVLAQSERELLAAAPVDDRLAGVARSVTTYLAPSLRSWRMLRLEAHLAARHRPRAAAVLVEGFEESLRTYPAATGLVEPERIAGIQPLLRYFVASVLGVGLVDSLFGSLQDVDWRPAIGAFGRGQQDQPAVGAPAGE